MGYKKTGICLYLNYAYGVGLLDFLDPFEDQSHKPVTFSIAEFEDVLGICGRKDIVFDHVPCPEQSDLDVAGGQVKTFGDFLNLHSLHLSQDINDFIFLGQGIYRVFQKGSGLFINSVVLWIHG